MSRLRSLALAAAALLAVCAFTGSAAAKTATTTKLSPIADCKANNGTLTRHYTLAQLETGLKHLSPSIKEYTTCNAAIQDAISTQLGTKNINGGSGASSNSSGGGSGTLILIIVIVVVILLGGGGAYWAYRRNRAGDGAGPAGSHPPGQA